MAFSWNDVSTLTANQRTALAYFEGLGRNQGPGGGLTADPDYTMSQCKAARAALFDMNSSVDAAWAGVRKCMEYYRNKAAKAFEEANP